MHYAKWKKPDTKSYILYDCMYMTIWKRKNYRDRTLSSCWQGAKLEGGNDYEEPRAGLGVWWKCLYLRRCSGCTTLCVCQYSECTLKMGEIYGCNLYLYKPDEKEMQKTHESSTSFLYCTHMSFLVASFVKNLNDCKVVYHLDELSFA